jgi:hypothetical protein
MQFVAMNRAPNPERRADQISKDDFNELRDSLTIEFNKCRDKVKAAVIDGDTRLKKHDLLHNEHKENFDKLFELAKNHDSRISASENQITLLISSNQHQHVQSDQFMGHIKGLWGSVDANNKVTQSISDRLDDLVKSSKSNNMPTAGQAAKSPVVWTIGGLIALIQVVVGVTWYFATGDATLIQAGH